MRKRHGCPLVGLPLLRQGNAPQVRKAHQRACQQAPGMAQPLTSPVGQMTPEAFQRLMANPWVTEGQKAAVIQNLYKRGEVQTMPVEGGTLQYDAQGRRADSSRNPGSASGRLVTSNWILSSASTQQQGNGRRRRYKGMLRPPYRVAHQRDRVHQRGQRQRMQALQRDHHHLPSA